MTLMSKDTVAASIERALAERFGERIAVDPALTGLAALEKIAAYRSHRQFLPRSIEPEFLRLLCACALSAPSKSDLQQSDILIVNDMAIRKAIVATIPNMPWINDAPAFLVFLANGERLPLVCTLRGKPFPNDHLDQFFNSVVDSAIVLASFVGAATAAGLGCCPISAIRNHAAEVSRLLALPDHVFPVAGLALGWPRTEPTMSLRLPLAVTVHRDRYSEAGLRELVDAYDARRTAVQPYATQRYTADFGRVHDYAWSEDKARQYTKPERETFGAFVRGKGFRLD